MEASWWEPGTTHSLATVLPHTKSVRVSVRIMVSNTLRLFDHDDRHIHGLHKARENWRNDRSVSWVSKHFSTLNAGAPSDPQIGKDVMTSTTPPVFRRRNRSLLLLMLIWKLPWNPTSLGYPTRLKGTVPISGSHRVATAASENSPHAEHKRKEDGAGASVQDG